MTVSRGRRDRGQNRPVNRWPKSPPRRSRRRPRSPSDASVLGNLPADAADAHSAASARARPRAPAQREAAQTARAEGRATAQDRRAKPRPRRQRPSRRRRRRGRDSDAEAARAARAAARLRPGSPRPRTAVPAGRRAAPSSSRPPSRRPASSPRSASPSAASCSSARPAGSRARRRRDARRAVHLLVAARRIAVGSTAANGGTNSGTMPRGRIDRGSPVVALLSLREPVSSPRRHRRKTSDEAPGSEALLCAFAIAALAAPTVAAGDPPTGGAQAPPPPATEGVDHRQRPAGRDLHPRRHDASRKLARFRGTVAAGAAGRTVDDRALRRRDAGAGPPWRPPPSPPTAPTSRAGAPTPPASYRIRAVLAVGGAGHRRERLARARDHRPPARDGHLVRPRLLRPPDRLRRHDDPHAARRRAQDAPVRHQGRGALQGPPHHRAGGRPRPVPARHAARTSRPPPRRRSASSTRTASAPSACGRRSPLPSTRPIRRCRSG